MDFHRTGQTWPHRFCPKHEVALELCINDTDYSKWSSDHQALYGNHDNRVAWRCESCLGFWFENHFIDDAEARRPQRIECAQLVLCCPSCNSRKVTHACVPECCGAHQCLDCDAALESKTETLKSGSQEKRSSPRLRGQGWTSSGGFRADHMHLTGVSRSFRTCGKPDHGQVELVLIDPIRICEAQVGWFCKDCERVFYEVGGLRSIRLGFQAEAKAMALCPECGSQYLNSIEEGSGRCRCVQCDAEIQVTLIQKAVES